MAYKIIAATEYTPFQQEMIAFYRNPNGTKMGKELMQQLKAIIHQITRNHKLEVRWGDYGGGSYFNEKGITFDPSMVPFCVDKDEFEEKIVSLKFISGHEVGHELITRYTEYMKELEKEGKITGQLELVGLNSLCNSIEDCRDNSTICREFRGFRTWTKTFYDPQFTQERTILFGDHQLLENIKKELGYTPHFASYMSEVIRFWHTGRFSTGLPEDVQKLLDTTKDTFVKAYKLLPRTFDEYEVDRTARESFDLIWKDIWLGGFRDLMEDVLRLEEDRLLMQNPDSMKELWDQLTPDEQQQLLDMIKEIMEQQQQNQQSASQQPSISGDGGSDQTQPDADQPQSPPGNGQIDKKPGADAKQEPGQSQGEDKSGDVGQPKPGQSAGDQAGAPKQEDIPKDWKGQLDMNQLPQPIKDKIDQVKERLAPEERDKLKQQADKNIGKVGEQLDKSSNKNKISKGNPKPATASEQPSSSEDAAGAPSQPSDGKGDQEFSMEPKGTPSVSDLSETQPPSSGKSLEEPGVLDHSEMTSATTDAEEPSLTQDELQQLREDSIEASQKLHEISSGSVVVGLNPYEMVMVQHTTAIDRMTSEIGSALEKKNNPTMRWHQDSGSYVNMNDAMQMEANPANYAVFGSKDIPDASDDLVILLFDISDSMNDPADSTLAYQPSRRLQTIPSKVQLAFPGLVQTIEALERNSVRTVLMVYNYQPRIIKDEDTNMSPQMREDVSQVLTLCAGGTNDADAIEFAYEYAKQISATHKWILPITDGGTSQREKLIKVLSRIAREGEMPLPIPLGFGSETEELKQNYPLSKGGLSPETLADFLPALITDMINNPQAYMGGEAMMGHFTTPDMLDTNLMYREELQ